MTEEWREVPGYPQYEVSNLGRVRSWTRKMKGKLMKLRLTRKGYPYVMFGTKVFTVHKLVLVAFVGPRPEGLMCLHADDDKTNACLTNLSWGTRSDNNKQAWRVGANTGRRQLSVADVELVRTSSMRNKELAALLSVDPSVISNVRRGIYYADV